MPSITECDHTIDPSGDVILTLRTPNAPLAVWRGVYDEPASDECLSSSSCSDVTFRLVSRQLIRASPVFKAALAGGAWKEGVAVADGDDPNAPPIFRIDVEDWDVEALVIVMNAIHGRAAPLSVTLETLARVAVVVDYYHVREALHHVTPYWLQHLRAVLRIPDSYGRELMLWICISLVFEDVDCLLRATHRAIWEASEERWNADCRELGLPIPPALVGEFWFSSDYDCRGAAYSFY
ncbi:hypothetical protein QBC46DRAFT_273271 [Diplogelasinospora grovesii]|uniref:BTB domain-containing protein n=1 Tax=Diplogelasinospora grovesii TaxID=303347 RepID=A0AAN6MZF9_9PEZI|nr:hypothetical protein QBC46DRAFT_273271 [Diplogelasinospora grovesii]